MTGAECWQLQGFDPTVDSQESTRFYPHRQSGRQLDHENPRGRLQVGANHPPAGPREPAQQLRQAHQPASLQRPWPARHKAWTAILAVAGLVVLLGVASVAAGYLETTGTASGQAAGGSPTSQASSPAASLADPQAKFVGVIKASLAAKGLSSSSTDAQLASAGARVCSARQDGAAQATLVSMWGSAPHKFAMSAEKFVGTAEKYLCPQFLPKPAAVILALRGSGEESSRSVLVSQPALQVKYSYDCSSFGGPGSFVADFETANRNSLDFDDQSIANALSPGGGDTITIYPQEMGREYHLAVNSQCDWSITISTSGS